MKKDRGPRKDWASRLGVQGEALVRYRLAPFALVDRIEEDIGVDFHCVQLLPVAPRHFEPGSMFYVQAKATEVFPRARPSVAVSTVRYWLECRAPVYVFIVDIKRDRVAWISIEKHRAELEKKLRRNPKTITFPSRDAKELSLESGDDFVKQINTDTNMIRSRERAKTFDMGGSGYLKVYPDAPPTREELRSCLQLIRVASHRASEAMMNQARETKDVKQKKKLLRLAREYSLAAWCVDKEHWEIPFVVGSIAALLDDYREAKEMFSESKKIMERDPKWMRLKVGKELFRRVSSRIKDFERIGKLAMGK